MCSDSAIRAICLINCISILRGLPLHTDISETFNCDEERAAWAIRKLSEFIKNMCRATVNDMSVILPLHKKISLYLKSTRKRLDIEFTPLCKVIFLIRFALLRIVKKAEKYSQNTFELTQDSLLPDKPK